jgi:hypothetical protein
METGTASAVMGNPINAVAWLANKLAEFGVVMQPGDVILSGSFIKAVPFEAGDSLFALFDQLGEVSLMVGDQPILAQPKSSKARAWSMAATDRCSMVRANALPRSGNVSSPASRLTGNTKLNTRPFWYLRCASARS